MRGAARRLLRTLLTRVMAFDAVGRLGEPSGCTGFSGEEGSGKGMDSAPLLSSPLPS